MTGALSPSHWLVILVVVLLLFGAKRLPDAARGVGRSLRIFKAETSALSEDGKKDPEPALEPGTVAATGSPATGSPATGSPATGSPATADAPATRTTNSSTV
ncbi:Sec-independent protein translocase subunit TatA [Actinomycetospora cinnamomea]|uniref:Sec-independent protein translocase protein TatA n=1 Tax=Actinomycetospora cinnamomea TaxID=663609 RepID=A0A2U1FBD6_9PSEU|nr:Sec-independent protein translocase subunit TatA [Actinomycetospora cinnamomea]PVZ09439.1 sec-independent protein translocase protein TatA [Actinomycetospora cinnamomea]